MSDKAKFDVLTIHTIKKLAAELTVAASKVDVYTKLERTACVDDTKLSITFIVGARLPLKTEEEIGAFLEASHVPACAKLVQIEPLILAFDSIRWNTEVTFSFVEVECPDLTNSQLCNLMTAATNYLENLAKTST